MILFQRRAQPRYVDHQRLGDELVATRRVEVKLLSVVVAAVIA
ncbi:hypothetical protein [Bradyrhizobium centrosematis]